MGNEERNPPGYFYQTNAINWVFFGSSLALLVLVVWMVWLDWKGFRDWKEYQETFYRLEAERLEKGRAEALAKIDPAAREALAAREREARRDLKSRRQDLETLQTRLRAVEARRYKVDQLYKFARAEIDKLRYDREEALRGHGAERPEAIAARMEETEARAHALSLELEAVEREQKALSAERDAMRAGIEEVERARAALFEEVDRIERALAKVAPTPLNIARNAPPLDVVDPTIRIKQVVLDELGDDYHFTVVPKVDRCTTCHLAIDRKGFENEPQPFRTHPNLDLYLSDASPHPMNRFGCTVCHGGRPRAVEFTRANHTPADEAQAQEWRETYGWHPDLEGHEWVHPMLPKPFLTASCYKCHKDEDHLAGAETLNHGKAAFQRFGCYGCHKTEGYEDAPPVAPDLSALAAKTTPDWAYWWIENPKAFRAETTMPRFFGLANAATEEDRRRDTVAVHAAVSYLFHFSQPMSYAAVPPGDPEKGKRAFQTLGCLACHAVGDLRPSSPSRLYVPDLSRIGDKTHPAWLYHWIRDPRHYYPDSRMPDLRLTDEEARDITAYLMTLKEAPPQPIPEPPADGLTDLAREFLAGKATHEDLETRIDTVITASLEKVVARIAIEESSGLLALALGEPRLAQVEGFREGMFSEIATAYDKRIPPGEARRFAAARVRARRELTRVTDAALAERLAALLADETRGLYRYVEGAPLARALADKVATQSLTAILETAQRAWSEAGLWTPTVEGMVSHLAGRYREEMARLTAADTRTRERLFVGERILNHYGCAGCHQIPGVPRGFGIGVELTGSQAIGSKDIHRFDFGFVPVEHSRSNFFLEKLKNPRVYDLIYAEGATMADAPVAVRDKKFVDKLRMPDFGMSPEEARAIATFLQGMVKDPIPPSYIRVPSPAEEVILAGERLLDRFNCAGCHVIEQARLVLDYDEKDPATGRTLTHRLDIPGQILSFYNEDEEETVEEFKPTSPVRAGNFALTGSSPTAELRALSGNPRFVTLAPSVGGGLGRDLAALYPDGTDKFDPVNFGPPILDGEGRKVRVAWLRDFLKAPEEIRPSVWPRMPTFPFTDRELTVLSQYFAYKDGLPHPLPPVPRHETESEACLAAHRDRIDKARAFFWGRLDKDANYCVKCHVVGDAFPPPENAVTKADKKAWAPDVERMAARLRPDWIHHWLLDPTKVLPGTNMPTFDWKEMEKKYGFGAEDMLAFLLNFHRLVAAPPSE